MATEAKRIAEMIEHMGSGRAFTASDFDTVASSRNAGNVLGRMHARGVLARAIRGVYYVPERSELLGTDVPVSVDEVVRAIARANKWVVAPSGDAALNALGLDTQVPAHPVYVSSGPYKTYSYGPYTIELRHRANRDLLDCSPMTCLLVQALKALGKDGVGEREMALLASSLQDRDIEIFRDEARGLTSWVARVAERLWETRYG